MQKLLAGVHAFQRQHFGERRELFLRLATGQAPQTLFITCADSRIDPALLTQTEPGELFMLRNAGNIVAPHVSVHSPDKTSNATLAPPSPPPSGEAATIEFAVCALGIRDIIVCGHSGCGAMAGLLEPDTLVGLPAVGQWLEHCEATRRIVREKYAHLQGPARLMATISENVLVQLDNLRTHPSVEAALQAGRVKLHGWVYELQTGEVYVYDAERGQFDPIGGGRKTATSSSTPVGNDAQP